MTDNARHNELTFHRDSQYISLSPEALAQLGGDITARKRVDVDDFAHGYDVREIRESLLLGDRIPNAGLIDVVVYRAARRGLHVGGTAETPIAVLPEPTNRSQIEYPAWAEFVFRENRGLVRVSKTFEIAVLIAELAVAFPESRIMLLGRVKDLEPAFTCLRQILPKETLQQRELAFVHSNRPLPAQVDPDSLRVVCCTPTAAADLDSEKYDIVVMCDAFQCMHELMAWPLIQADARFRLFGVLRAGRKPKPYEHARLHQVFGFQELNLMSFRRVRRDLHFAWVRHSCQAPVDAVLEGPVCGTRKSAGLVNSISAYVHNHHRNDLISRLARKLRSGNPIAGEKFRDVRQWLQGRERRPLNVTVVVDQLDHAIQLSRKLADWPIMADPKNNLHNLSSGSKRRINSRSQSWNSGQIVVVSAGWRYGGFHSDIVIWAGGGSTAQIPEFWGFSSNNPARPMLIIDFLDAFTQETQKLSFKRRDDLTRRDIFRVGTSAIIGRIQRFEKAEGSGRP